MSITIYLSYIHEASTVAAIGKDRKKKTLF